MSPKKPTQKPIVPPAPEVVNKEFVSDLPPEEVANAGASDAAPVAGGTCTTCGWPVAPGATCEVDGTVAP